MILHVTVEKETYVDEDGQVEVKLTVLEGPLADRTFTEYIPSNLTTDIPEEY